MGAGALNRRVAVQVKTRAPDSTGQMVETWVDSFFVCAQIITTGSGELYAAQKQYAQTNAVIRIRFTNRVTARNRIRDGHQVYEILGQPNNENGLRKYLLLNCKGVS